MMLFLVSLLQAESTLHIGTEERYVTKKFMHYTLAHDLNETPTSLTNRVWEEDKSSFNSLENLDKAYWAKLSLVNSTNKPKHYYLKSENQFTYYIEFFMVKNSKIVAEQKDGVIVKEKARLFNSNHMIFPVTLAPFESMEVYFKILNYNKIDIDFRLLTQEYLLDFYQTYNIIEGIFFGGMLLLFLYHLFLYFLLKSREYLYYLIYTFWVTMYFMGFFGFMERYFPDYMFLFQISAGSFFIAMVLFIQRILNLKEQLPRIHKILNIFMVVFSLSTVLYVIFLEAKMFLYTQIIFDLFFLTLPFYIFLIIGSTYYLAFYKESHIAKVYALIWTLVAFAGLILPIVYLNILELDFPIDYIFQFVMLFEVLGFSFILAYKIKEMENEKLEQQKLLVQQSRLASMGEMISTIAGQWKKPLSEINGIVLDVDIDYREKQLTQERLDEHLNDIEEVTGYLSKTIHDFMNFFNHNKTLEHFYLSTILEQSRHLSKLDNDHLNSLLLFGTEHANSKEFLYKFKEIEMIGYPSELIQALLIVMNNVAEASLKQAKRAQLLIDISMMDDKVKIRIEDNLGGIDEGILENVFMHNFSTSGLGLYILKIIIEQNMKGKVELVNGKAGLICTLTIPQNLNIK